MKFVKITSPANPIIKEALKIKERRAGYRHGAFLIEGPHLMEMAAASPDVEIKRVFFTEEFSNRREGQRLLRQIMHSVERGTLSVERTTFIQVSEPVLNKLADTETPQGIVAIVSCKIANLDKLSFKGIPFLVVCGSAFRIPETSAPIIRASMQQALMQ